MEVLLTLPIVVLTLVSGVHYGIAGVTKQTVQCAASAAANEAALGGTKDDIRIAADEALSVHELKIGTGLLLLIEDASGVRCGLGDRSAYPDEPPEKRRELLNGEFRATLFVVREATGIPRSINFLGTEINNGDLIAVATSMAH